MKNLIIATFVTMFSVSSVHLAAANGDNGNKKEKSTPIENSKGIGGGINFYFGKDWKAGCPGRGLCKITISVETDFNTNMLYKNDDHEIITLIIPKEYIRTSQPEKLQYFEGQNSFVVEQDYKLDKEICVKIGAPENTIIKAGNYPMTYQNSTWTIKIEDLQ